MGFCEFLDTNGSPPENCGLLVGYLNLLVDALSSVNQIRVVEVSALPSAAGLTALWVPCDVPIGAMAFWYDTLAAPDVLYQFFYDATENWILLDSR